MTRQVNTLEVRVDGRRFDGFWAVQSNMLTVWNPSLGSRTAPIDDASMQQLTDSLLREIVRDCAGHRYLQSAGMQ